VQAVVGDCNIMFWYSMPYSLVYNDVSEKPAYILRGKTHRVTSQKIASIDKMAHLMRTLFN